MENNEVFAKLEQFSEHIKIVREKLRTEQDEQIRSELSKILENLERDRDAVSSALEYPMVVEPNEDRSNVFQVNPSFAEQLEEYRRKHNLWNNSFMGVV